MDALNHQLANIPEVKELAALKGKRVDLDNAARDLRILVDDLTAEQKKADRDVEQVKARQLRDQSMLDSGAVGDPKALERMLGEVESLKRRISDLEDVEIEVMERLETAQSDLDTRGGELEALDAQAATLTGTITARQAELGHEVESVQAERKAAVSGLPDDLLALYERLRTQKGGVGAAALRAKQCGGCRLTLDASILGEIREKPTDEVVRCEECSRILVRTGESGL